MKKTVVGFSRIGRAKEQIGILVTKDSSGKFHAKMGCVAGKDMKADLVIIEKIGAKIPLSAAVILIDEKGHWLNAGKPSELG